jgi:hypothetical protein
MIFHQGLWYLSNQIGLIPPERPVWPLDPIPPFSVPSVISKAFWGGSACVAIGALQRRKLLGKLDSGRRDRPPLRRLLRRAAPQGRAHPAALAAIPRSDAAERNMGLRIATAAALVVGKAVLLANALPVLRRFDQGPLIRPIMFKTMVYFAVVFVVRFLEKIIEYGFSGGTLAEIPQYVTEHYFLAPLCCYPDLDLRAVLDLCHCNGAKHAVWRWRTRQDLFHHAFIGPEADPTVTDS